MISILKTELFRLKKSKVFWALLIVSGALPVVGVCFILLFWGLLELLFSGSIGNAALDLDALSAQNALASLDHSTADFAILALIATAIVLSREFTHGTARNIILANKTREQTYFAFFLTAIIIASCYLGAEFLTTTIMYGAIFGFGGVNAGAAITAILCHLILGICAMLFVVTLVCMFLFATRKQSLTIVFPLLMVFFVPSTLTGIASAIVVALTAIGQTVSEVALQCIPFVNLNYIDATHPAGLAMGMAALYYLLFAAMFFVIGFFSFRKSDLK